VPRWWRRESVTAATHHPSVVALLKATPTAANADVAIRLRARALIDAVRSVAAWDGPPFDLEALASFRGFRVTHSGLFDLSQDACIMPGIIALNASKQPRRRRYSLAHEIAHTLFPDYDDALKAAGKLWRENRRTPADDPANRELERLCDVGASELLLPEFVFRPLLLAGGFSLASIVGLRARFDASFEATSRRASDSTDERAMTVIIQPWDTQLRRTTREYSPRAPLRVSRSYTSPASAHWVLPAGTSVPLKSVATKAWTHAPIRTRGVEVLVADELWVGVNIGASIQETFECQAMTLPLRARAPSEVLMLMRQA
jgi:Zn-dependent peptidase ImmA (M78 family)